ncbi:MAG: peptide chain release factor N(5)-glutamine methyltransferase [Ostreibacterium sp.]
MTTIKDWRHITQRQVSSDIAEFDLELLLSFRLGKNRAFLHAFDDYVIEPETLKQLTQDLRQLDAGYPLAYLTGEKAFWDMRLKVSEDTLIPRADTETLIEVAQQLLPKNFNQKIIDLGTGSGAIAIALSRLFPQASIWASDFHPSALAVAQQNATTWQKSPLIFVQADWLTPLDGTILPDKFDVIVSNPPYIEENDPHLTDLQYEPISALSAPDKGLADIKSIIIQSQKKLQHNGWLILEHGFDQSQSIHQYLHENYWNSIKTYQDLGGNERVTVARYHCS